MKINKESWDRYAASNAQKRKKSAALRAIHQHVTALRAERASRKAPMPKSARQRLMEIRARRDMQRRAARAEAERNERRAIRDTMTAAMREARRLGFEVKVSTARTGEMSSIYATRANRRPIRISDHHMPATPKREYYAEMHGGSPFAAEIIIDAPMTPTRIRRLLVLAEASRV